VRKTFFLIFIILLTFLFFCSENTKSEYNTATLYGTVYGINDANKLDVLSGAQIDLQNYFVQAYSDQQGEYQISLELGDEIQQINVQILASKAGYESGSTLITAKKGESVKVPDITLKKIFVYDTSDIDPNRKSGEAAHIEVYGSHSQHIYVLSSGLQETARINFIVRDSKGIPVDEDHKANVKFEILDGPEGGEYLDPDNMTTENGLVFTVLNSGIVAGPLQLQAWLTTASGKNIYTFPIRLAIYGGLPDPIHFSTAVHRLNIAGLKYLGILDEVTAYVGDQYSNPVAPGTVVYFSTDYGIVDGSAVTDEMGQATVNFMSAFPLPPNPLDSSFVHITSWTYSDTIGQRIIKDRARILLSDQTAPIAVSPTSFTYSAINNPINFNYTVRDIWGNPIVGGSKIEVSATDGDLFGDINIDLLDTQYSGPGTTQFNFTWAPGENLEAPQVYINIKVTTPENGNGYRSVNIIGTRQ
jgi:hypothetical protein